jgi:hypothetical protein
MSLEKQPIPDGRTPATAVPVQRVSEELEWIRRHYPNARVVQQALEMHSQGPRDVLVVMAESTITRVYFDISSFFGRSKEDRPTAPCPHCGRPLRTPRAKQCRHCRSEWHTN